MIILVLVLTTVFFTSSVSALNEADVKDIRCVNIKTNPQLDQDWMTSIKRWYYPMASRLDVYRTASDMLNLPINKLTYRMVMKSCENSDDKFQFTGFGVDRPLIIQYYDDEGVAHFKGTSNYSLTGTQTFGFTDNQNFIVGVICWADNQASYIIYQTRPEPLVDSIKQKVLGYLEGLGFNLKFLMENPCSAQLDACTQE